MYAVLHPSNFFAQAAAHQRPELRKRSFVVLDGEPPTEMVFAANNAARSQGVEIGMTRLQAEAFSEVVALRRVIEHEYTAHATLHHVACKFSGTPSVLGNALAHCSRTSRTNMSCKLLLLCGR